MRRDGRTDRHIGTTYLIVPFRNFANAFKRTLQKYEWEENLGKRKQFRHKVS